MLVNLDAIKRQVFSKQMINSLSFSKRANVTWKKEEKKAKVCSFKDTQAEKSLEDAECDR